MERTPIIGIYRIYNKVNKKVYIGQSMDIVARWEAHFSSYKEEKRYNTHLYRAMRKYGINCFEFSIEYPIPISEFENLSEEDKKNLLSEIEKGYIQVYGSFDPRYGYNETPGGEGGSLRPELLLKRNEAIKKAWESPSLREAAKQRAIAKYTPDVFTFRGKKHSEDSLRKMRQPHKTYIWSSEELRKEQSETHSQLNKNSRWYHLGDVERFINISKTSIPEGWELGRAPFSLNYREKRRDASRGGNNVRAIPVECIETGEKFFCLKDVANKYGWNYVSLQSRIKKGLPYKGFTFRIYDEVRNA